MKRGKALQPISEKRRAAQRANSSKRVYERRGREQVCETCGEAFYVRPSSIGRRRYCSQTCMGVANRKSRQRACSVCSVEFEHPARSPRKTCSAACAREAKRRSKKGARNPQWRGGSRSSSEAWKASLERLCRVCGEGSRRLYRHHVVYEQHVLRAGGNRWDPDDSLTVCLDCHGAHHHNADGRIAVSKLRKENIDFAFSLLGAYAVDYFTRYYNNDLFDDLMERAQGLMREATAREIVGR